MMVRKIKAGFVGFGEVNSPRDLIERKVATARGALEERDIELVSTAPVSDDPRVRTKRAPVANWRARISTCSSSAWPAGFRPTR